jgi:hypothetical protein
MEAGQNCIMSELNLISVKMIKSRRMRLPEHETWMREMRNISNILFRRCEYKWEFLKEIG